MLDRLLIDNCHRRSATVASAHVPRQVDAESMHQVVGQQGPHAAPCFRSEDRDLSGHDIR